MFAEFTDSWSDDFATLRDARHALLSQSTSGESIKARNATFCRHLAISIVGSVEYLLQTWRQRDVSNVLGPYFSHPRNTPTKVRLESLLEGFQRENISIESSTLEDYLAVKFLRNTIEHSGWYENEKAWIESRGFPTDVREFRKEDFDRMAAIYNDLVVCIGQTAFKGQDRDDFKGLARDLSE